MAKNTVKDTVRCPKCNNVINVEIRDIEVVGVEE